MNRRSFLPLAVIVVSVLLLSACGGTPTPATEAPEPTEVAPPPTEEVKPTEEPVVLRVGILQDVDCWNPAACYSFWFTADLWADPYLGKGTGCEALPTRLLDSWEMSEDGLTWTFKLHEGITFSNGEPLDAEVAAGFLEWWSSIPSISFIYKTTELLDSVEVIDDVTFQLKTTSPIPFLFDAITIYPQPPSVTSTLTDENVTTFENFPPIGAGPYTVTEWVPGSSITFDANPEYHRGKPPIDRIVVQIFSNTDALVNSLIAGDIDMTTLLSGDFVETMKQTPNTAIYAEPPRYKYELEFNVASSGKKHPAIDDPAVREAIDYSINRQRILDVALLGYGQLCPTNWACPSVSPDQVNPDLAVTPYDLVHAKQILEAAGYRDADGDGILETAAGEPLQFRLAYESADPVELTIADMITADMKEIGIGTEIEAVETGMVNDLLNGRDFDLLIYRMYTDVFAPIQLNWTSTCAAAEAKASGHNFPGFCNKEFDDLVNAAYAALDKEKLQEALFSAETILYDERPFVILAAMTRVQGVRSDRFEFPRSSYCQLSGGGLMFTDVLMNAVVK